MRLHGSFLIALGLAAAAGCSGQIAGGETEEPAGTPAPGERAATPGSPGAPAAPGAAPTIPPPAGSCAVGPSPMRRLTKVEYENTVRDLLGVPPAVLATQVQLLPDPGVDGFDNNAGVQQVTLPQLQQYVATADALAEAAARDLPKLVGCDVAAKGEAACAAEFIRAFARRAYRRPPSAQEEANLKRVHDTARAGADFAGGVTAVVQAVLLAPQFLYRLEVQPGTARPDGAVALSPFELATRLSYLLWGTMPDAELFAAAETGKLRTKAEVRAQAERMLASSRAKTAIARFHEHWLDLGGFPALEKDPKLFPQFTGSIAEAMAKDTAQFLDHVFWQEGGKMSALLQAPYIFRNSTLAKYYGEPGYTKPAGDDGSKLIKVDTDPKTRAGLLTQGGFLALISKRDNTGPVERGKFVRERLLCGTIPPPPPDVVQALPEPPPPYTTRQRLEHTERAAACAPCHKLMNPLGLALENYDAAGRYRTTENGLPIDASGQIHDSDAPAPFVGAAGMAERLLASGQAQSCVARTYFRWAHGRTETDADACTIRELAARFAGGGLSVRELLLAITQTDAFLHRSLAEGAMP